MLFVLSVEDHDLLSKIFVRLIYIYIYIYIYLVSLSKSVFHLPNIIIEEYCTVFDFLKFLTLFEVLFSKQLFIG